MEKTIIPTSVKVSDIHYDNGKWPKNDSWSQGIKSTKSITGTISIDFTTCGDFSYFINEDEEIRIKKLVIAITESILMEKISINQKS